MVTENLACYGGYMLPVFKSLLFFLFLQYNKLPLIAADGASNKLISDGLTPDFIIGDLDSIAKQYLTTKYNIIHIKDQNTTDFEKCLAEMQTRDLFPSLVLGITGGEIDHSIYNLNCFMRHAKEHELFFLDVDENNKFKWGLPVFGKKTFAGKIGKTISLMPFPEAIVSSIGLKWDLIRAPLAVAANSSIRNVVTKEKVTIQVHSGNLLVILD